MSTAFDAAMPITRIHAHPNNPRHAAAADDDMVASIREGGLLQPVVVAPHPDKAGSFVLIAGHRRLDGSKKAKAKTVPVVIRDDLVTEGQQIEAMIIENGHRLDLTPIEEAEGYAQLELLGYKPAAIATAVGRSITTVRARLGLLKLSETTRKKVHVGQLKLEDAVAIGEFANDKKATDRLEKAALSGNLSYTLATVRAETKRAQDNAVVVARLLEVGATAYKFPKGKTDIWQLTREGVVAEVRDDAQWSIHKTCLAYRERDAGSSYSSVQVLCTSPSKHSGKALGKSAAEIEREKQWAKDQAEREKKRAEEEAARSARIPVLMGLVAGNVKLPPAVADLLRTLLPAALFGNYEQERIHATYEEALGILEPDRWSGINNYGATAATHQTLVAQHTKEISEGTDAYLVKALAALLIGFAEDEVDYIKEDETAQRARVRGYYQLLTEAGYVPVEPDLATLKEIEELDNAAVEQAEAS